MFIDAADLADGSALEAHVCIVGAGAAGITIATELDGGSCQVVLLESGGLVEDRHTQALYRGETAGLYDMPLAQSRFRYFGGSTNRWAGWCRPLDLSDFESRSWISHSGWPFGREELDPCYERAGRVCEIEDSRMGAESRVAALELGDGRLQTAAFRLSPPTRFGRRYRDQLAMSRNTRVILNANAIAVCSNPESARIESVSLRTLGGKNLSVRSRIFILATGGIENARLLLASSADPQHAPGNGEDLVGRFYMDHAAFFSGSLDPTPGCPDLSLYTTEHISNPAIHGQATAGFALHPRLLREECLLNSVARLVPRPAYTMHPDWESEAVGSARLLVSSIARGELPFHTWTHALRTLTGAGKSISSAVRVGVQKLRPQSRLALRCWVETAPDPESRVTLSEKHDALGQRAARVSWKTGGLEKRSAIRLHEIMSDEFSSRAYGEISQVLRTPDDPWPVSQSGASHHIGTTRMHDSPRKGVVDRDCRVHGLQNLYVAGSSVFPTSGYANPTLTIVALALRLADRIKRAVDLS